MVQPLALVQFSGHESKEIGVTTLLPFVITRDSYVDVLPGLQKAVGEGLVDMAFHAIVIRERQVDEIPRMAHEFGVRAFKTFMAYKGREISPSGIQGLGDDTIFSVFQKVVTIPGGIAIVHCENMELIELHQKPFVAAGRQDTAAWSERVRSSPSWRPSAVWHSSLRRPAIPHMEFRRGISRLGDGRERILFAARRRTDSWVIPG